ncbi:MAG: ABC transporter permease [Acidimicrobiales bacterium]
MARAWLIGRGLRQRWFALLPVALIVALGSTGALVAFGAAERTANAYPRYLDRAAVGDVLLNPSLNTIDIDEIIRSLPGVEQVTSDALLQASLDEGAPRTLADARTSADPYVQVRGSVDGRYTATDRPALIAGRSFSGSEEAIVSAELADAMDVAVGDVVPVAFWQASVEFADPNVVHSPVGVERLTVVGIATFPDEVLPDELYPRLKLIVSPDVVERYDCLPESPPRDVSFDEALAALLPEGCAVSYRYYSLGMAQGDAGVAPALEVFLGRAEELNAELPVFDDEGSPSYFLIATTTAQERQRVERSNQPTVAALLVLGLAAAAVTLVVLGLAVVRELRRRQSDQRQWWQLGLARGDRMWALAIPLLGAVGLGLATAVPLSWLLSPVGPAGLVRSVEPDPARSWSSWVGFGAVAMAAVCGIGVVALVYQQSRRVGAAQLVRRREPALVNRVIGGAGRPETAEGLRAAFGGHRSAGLVVASGGVAAAVFLGAVIFGTSLATVVTTPASYGWPWDLAVMTGAGYGDLDTDAVDATLGPRDDVDGWSLLGFTNEVTIDGAPVLAVIGFDELSALDINVVEGRLPAGTAQVALGSRTAAQLDLDVGDQAEVRGGGVETGPVTVTGIVVLPALGPLNSDRAAPGVGMLLPATMADNEEDSLVTFAGIDLAPGADRRAVADELHDAFGSWDLIGEDPFRYAEPVRPAEIVNAETMRVVPLIVGGLLVVTAAIGLSVAVVISVRSRRRELAILRALGLTGGQVRRSVRVQSVATMAGALVVGVPVGVLIGRLTWRAFAAQLGVVDDPTISALWILATVLGGLAIAVLVAAVPARSAARAEPALILRTP